jgi:hypothetical protein
MRTILTAITKVFLVSFEVSYLITKNKKPQTFGEMIFLPASIKLCEIMYGAKRC